MNLVNELQVSAEREDVLTVLRKARRLASKLGVTDIDDWLNAEQNGYTANQAVPSYRLVYGSLVFDSNGPIQIGHVLRSGIIDCPGGQVVNRAIGDSMGQVMALIESNWERGYFLMRLHHADLGLIRNAVPPHIANQVTFALKINLAQVRAFPEAVKDKILDWACALERQGIVGDNMTFNADERAVAHTVTFNISNSKIEQLNNMGKNQKG